MKRILILGISSMIGNQLYEYFIKSRVVTFGTIRNVKKKKSNIFYYDPEKNFNGIQTLIKKTRPHVVINTIGITKHNKDINNFKRTIYINSIFPHKLAQIITKKNLKLIHLSTDCVFNGEKGNYSEIDIPDSNDLYGISKSLGEIKYKNCLTIRTSFIGFENKNKNGFLEWILNNKSKTIPGFSKAFYNGLTTLEISKIILKIINLKMPIYGLIHLSSKKISKYNLILLIIKKFKLKIKVIKNKNFYCDRTLNSKLIKKKLKLSVPSWEKMIDEMSNNRII